MIRISHKLFQSLRSLLILINVTLYIKLVTLKYKHIFLRIGGIMMDICCLKDQSLLGKLKELRKEIIYKTNGAEDAISSGIEKLEAIALDNQLSVAQEKELFAHAKMQGLDTFFQTAFEQYETQKEQDFAADICSGVEKDISQYFLYNRFTTLIDAEIRLGKPLHNDKLLFIGSGPFPISPILFHQYTGCTIDCYDMDRTAVYTGREVVQALEMQNKINIYNRDGRDLQDTYDLVIVALLAKPKQEILKKAFSATTDGKIICRTSDGLRRLFYEPTVCGQYDAKYTAKGNNIISSLLL
jgi:hypothetical protein